MDDKLMASYLRTVRVLLPAITLQLHLIPARATGICKVRTGMIRNHIDRGLKTSLILL